MKNIKKNQNQNVRCYQLSKGQFKFRQLSSISKINQKYSTLRNNKYKKKQGFNVKNLPI